MIFALSSRGWLQLNSEPSVLTLLEAVKSRRADQRRLTVTPKELKDSFPAEGRRANRISHLDGRTISI